MSGSGKERFGVVSLAVGISFISICISLACLVQVYFVAKPECSCALFDADKSPSQLKINVTEKSSEARADTGQEGFVKPKQAWKESVWQSTEERKGRVKRRTQHNLVQGASSTVLGGYLHNALLRLQQQMIIVEGRTQQLLDENRNRRTQHAPRGPPGSPGVPGRDGVDGRSGMDGPMGLPGRDGPNGKDGQPGAAGAPGPPGVNGLTGHRGEKGVKGDKGESGHSGTRGLNGIKGSRGISGIPGENGEPGIPGRGGNKGERGDPGETTCYVTDRGRRLEKPCSEAAMYETSGREQKGANGGGLTYIRWGRTTCPAGGARIVYSGQAAGTSNGKLRTGGSPYICVPNQPWYFGQMDPSTPLANISRESHDAMIADPTRSTLHGTYFYVSCVLCLVRQRSVQIMLPARKECYRGWHREYDGFLAVQTNRKDHRDVICLDRDSRGLLRDAQYVRGLFASCESFSCPPYVETERLPCVVCSI